MAQCAKAVKTGKRDNLPSLVINLNAAKREDEDKPLAKSNRPPKTAGIEHKPTTLDRHASTTITTVAKPRVQVETGKASSPKENKKRRKQEKPREEQAKILAIESDLESDPDL